VTLTSNLFETLPGVTRTTQGTADDLVSRLFLNIMRNDADNLVCAIDEHMVRPMMVLPFRLMIFAITFVVVSMLISAVSKSMNLKESIYFSDRKSAVLGGFMGAAFGVAIVALVAVTVSAIVSLSGDNVIFLNTPTVEQSFLFRYVYGVNFLQF
jgi:hypothetical protein